MNFRRLAICVFALMAFFCASSGWAQSSGTINGVVKDPSGAILPDATVANFQCRHGI